MVLEEGVGFEPTEVSPSSVFKTDAIGHSANLPFGTELFSGNLCSVLGMSHHIIGRNKEWEVCMVNAQPLNHNMIISYIETFVNYLLKCLQFCNNYIHQLYFEFVHIALQ